MVAGTSPVRDSATDLCRHPVRLLGPARKGLDTDRHRIGRHAFGAQPLRDAGPDLEAIRVVEADQAICSVQHRRMRSIVAPQDDRPRTAVTGLEVEDVVDRRAPEGIDRLVVVADDRHVAMSLGEQPDELRLRPVRVLELVDEDVPEAGLDPLASLGRLADEPERECDLVAEVDEAAGREQVLVARVGTSELELPARCFRQGLGVHSSRVERGGRLGREALGERHVGAGRDVLVLAAAEERRQRREEPGRVAERPVLVQLELEEVLAHEDDHFGARQHSHVGRQSEFERELPDQAVAECMERRDRGVRVAVRDELIDTDRHLLGRLVGERQGEDLRRTGTAGGNEPGDPAGDDLRLARPGAGHDQQRTLAVGHRSKLIRVEAAEQRVEADRILRRGWCP